MSHPAALGEDRAEEMSEIGELPTCFAAARRASPLGLVSLPRRTSEGCAPPKGIFSSSTNSNTTCAGRQPTGTMVLQEEDGEGDGGGGGAASP